MIEDDVSRIGDTDTLTTDSDLQQAELLSIEALVNEFYHPGTSNVRKHTIEGHLQQFQRMPHAWLLCLQNLNQFNNQYFWFFNVSTVEVTISQRWLSLEESRRNQIRDALWSTYAGFSQDIPGLQRDKIAQLVALVGKRQFPEEHPDYMNQVLELLKSKFTLGITLLRATSDEITSTKADITSERQKYLTYCVSMYLPSVFDILEKYAELCITRTTNCKNGISLAHLPAPFGEDSRLEQATTDLLICVQQIFSWAPLDNITSPKFFQSLFMLALWNNSYKDISISALTTISELFYRQKPLPQPTVIATGVLDLLQPSNMSILLKLSNELYQDKLTELLRLFTTQQWAKWSKDPHFPAMSYLNALFQYTFFGFGALAFTERLAIWTPIIQGIVPGENGLANKHIDKLVALASGTVKRMLFQYDYDQLLDMFDNEELDDENETELQHFFNQCIDTIALIAEVDPTRVYDAVFGEFSSNASSPYAEVLSTVGLLRNGVNLNTPPSIPLDEDERSGLRCKFRDFISLCQIITRISPALHERSERMSISILCLIRSLIKLVDLVSSATGDPLEYFFAHSSSLAGELAEVFGQTLITLRSLLLVAHIPIEEDEMIDFVGSIPRFLLPVQKVKRDQLKTLSSAAAQLLLSVSGNLRPKYLVQFIKPLVHSDLRHLERPTALIVRRAICNCFVLPWARCSTEEQNFEGRGALLQEYIAFIAGDLTRLDLGHSFGTIDSALDYGQEEKIVSVATSVLTTLRDLLDFYQEQSSSVKQMLATAYRPVIEKTLTIYSAANSRNCLLIEQIFDFSLGIIRTLQIQLGQMFLKSIIQLFLEKTKAEQITTQRYRSLNILLKIFLLIVEQPGHASLLPDILTFSIEHVLPLVFCPDHTSKSEQSDHADFSLSLYMLFNGILLQRWQYFYKSSVLKQISHTATGEIVQHQSTLEHSDQFAAIMNAYGQAIVCSNDPHITRATLQSLQVLNERWKLYQREFFCNNLLQSFEAAIIKALVAPEGILHYDLFLAVLYSMGEVGMKRLHETFIGIGFSADSLQVEEVCMATDYPTFAHRMNQLVQDTKCGQLNELV
ncbi:exportin-6-A isoform X2 [Malaya genurostris]|uniref:exportin-6-A isoform X2 n=1 Tax=Malaya genurostris TaxID=325434 RepID=UPI0026F3AAA8|nr:exportin-6-A isoform X2 [Malaya genurostris]